MAAAASQNEAAAQVVGANLAAQRNARDGGGERRLVCTSVH